jgi:NADPH:quinone reductase
MIAIQIKRTGGPEVLECVDLPMPKPGPGEVLVRAESIGVHYFDTLIRAGRYRWMPKLPFVLGNDMCGHVVAGKATKLRVGQPVFIAGWDIGFRGGLYAEYVTAPEKNVWPLPDTIDPDDAAALCNYAFAWTLLHQVARGIEPRNVLVHGAAGGVGTALAEIARLAGANVIGLADSEEKCAFLRERKTAHVINYNLEPTIEGVSAATGGRGADIIFNHVAGNTFSNDLKMLAPLGLIVSYAALGGMPDTDLFKDMRANIDRSPALRCFTMHTSEQLPELRSEGMKHAIEFLAAKKISPAIGARLPLWHASGAHELLESRRAMGKIILKP